MRWLFGIFDCVERLCCELVGIDIELLRPCEVFPFLYLILVSLDVILRASRVLYKRKTVAEDRSKHRPITNKLRKMLWTGIEGIVTPYVGSDPERR